MKIQEGLGFLKRHCQVIGHLPCWHVSCGESVGASFQLAFGKRIRRDTPLTNTAQPEEYRQNDGEVNLLVWCTWRLDTDEQPMTSSDDTLANIQTGLRGLIGASVVSFEIYPPAWDCVFCFDNGMHLKLFSDHVPGAPSIDGNWDFISTNYSLYVGPGSAIEFKRKSQEMVDRKGTEKEQKRGHRRLGKGRGGRKKRGEKRGRGGSVENPQLRKEAWCCNWAHKGDADSYINCPRPLLTSFLLLPFGGFAFLGFQLS